MISGMSEGVREGRLDPDSVIVFSIPSFDIESRHRKEEKEGDEAMEFPEVREACPESGSKVDAGWRRFRSSGPDFSAAMSSALTTGAWSWPSLIWL